MSATTRRGRFFSENSKDGISPVQAHNLLCSVKILKEQIDKATVISQKPANIKCSEFLSQCVDRIARTINGITVNKQADNQTDKDLPSSLSAPAA